MGDHKRYIGVRLYLPTSEPTTKEGGETGIDVKPPKMGMGGDLFSVKSRREQYKDSRLTVLRSGGGDYIYLLFKLAGISITAAIISAVGGGWKGYVVGAMIFFIGCAYLAKDVVFGWLKRYWR